MIQDIYPHVYDNFYNPQKPDPESYLLCYKNRDCLMREENGEIFFPTFQEAEQYDQDIYESYTYLFSIDGERYYLLNKTEPEWFPEYEWKQKEQFRYLRPKYRAFAGITGYQLSNWYSTRKYCGACGSRMHHDKKERMMRCEKCGNMEFPKICPAVIVGVTDGDRILMSKYAGRSYKFYALLAGFVEVGEPVEDTIRREVMEEVGIKVKNIRYYKSQPWSFTDTLLLGFFCDLDGDDTIILEQEELAEARWFHRDEVPEVASMESLTNEMIMAFKNGEQ